MNSRWILNNTRIWNSIFKTFQKCTHRYNAIWLFSWIVIYAFSELCSVGFTHLQGNFINQNSTMLFLKYLFVFQKFVKWSKCVRTKYAKLLWSWRSPELCYARSTSQDWTRFNKPYTRFRGQPRVIRSKQNTTFLR